MERRRRPAGRATPGRVTGDKLPRQGSGTPAEALPAALSALSNIQAVVDGGGQVLVGTIKPIKGAAVAHDGTKTLAMLRRRPHESIAMLLDRLDTAIGIARRTGTKVDELNGPSSDKTYKL